MNNSFFLEVRPIPGCNIKDAAENAVRIAQILQVTVRFEFNGIAFAVWPKTAPEAIVQKYQQKTGETVL